jgi:hypothetical protein
MSRGRTANERRCVDFSTASLQENTSLILLEQHSILKSLIHPVNPHDNSPKKIDMRAKLEEVNDIAENEEKYDTKAVRDDITENNEIFRKRRGRHHRRWQASIARQPSVVQVTNLAHPSSTRFWDTIFR